jgi:hypothetical protein
VNAIVNCHLAIRDASANEGAQGCSRLTGQPNAWAVARVGGFVNTLAAHVDLHDEPGRAAVEITSGAARRSPANKGPKAVEMFDRIHDGSHQSRVDHGYEPVLVCPMPTR